MKKPGYFPDSKVRESKKESVSKVCHCGLDPQSSVNQVFFFMRLRVKPAMTSIDLVQ